MANKLFKNFIVCGEIDYFCLLCKEVFNDLSDLDKHIRWESHRKKVKSQARIPKFKKDDVFKVEDKFYCEVCNFIAFDMETMNTHIGQELHKTNKDHPKTEKEATKTKLIRDSGYIVVADVIVPNRAWHGITDTLCLTCGKGFDDILNHIISPEHILQLILAEVVIIDGHNCYRKLDPKTFYCFTCTEVLPISALETHWSDQKHRANDIGLFRTTFQSASTEEKKMELMMKLILAQSDLFDINTHSKQAACKKCAATFDLDLKALLGHKQSHQGEATVEKAPGGVLRVDCPSSPEEPDEVVYQEVTDHGKRRSDLAKFGKSNFIKLNSGGSRGYCSLCHNNLSASMTYFKEHVKGARHRGFLELLGIKKIKEHAIPGMKFKPISEYLHSAFFARAVKVLWINKEFCIESKAFAMVSEVEKNPHMKKTKCYSCDIYYPQGEDTAHFNSEQHKKSFLKAKVLALKGEFIREVRPDIYHCGFCNIIQPFWELMEKHMLTPPHIAKKNDKDLVLRIADEWFNETILTKTSQYPDILYVQLMSYGIFGQEDNFIITEVEDS